jgi:hypothetical protein
MNLTAEQFQQIISRITVVGEDERMGATDRRRPRAKAKTHVPVCPWDAPADALSVQIRDISTGGIGILFSRRMALDAQFVARLPRTQGGDALLLCKVIYWEPLAENLFAIGAQFEREVTEDELNARQEQVSPTPTGIIARLTGAVGNRRRTAM